MVARGILFQHYVRCDEFGVNNVLGENCLVGIGYGVNNIPIDMVCLYLAGYCSGGYEILLVDEFQRLNGVPEQDVVEGLGRIEKSLEGLSRVYGLCPKITRASDFMRTEEYAKTLRQVEEKVGDLGLRDQLLMTVPAKYRESDCGIEYPLNEIACVEFLRKARSFTVKFGPSKEKMYDDIMRSMDMKMKFSYVIDAYALGTSAPELVVHYIPTHKGFNGGQRLFLDDPLLKAKAKLRLGPEDASRYLLKLASAAGYVLGKEHPSPDEIEQSHGKGLKKKCARLVLENILEPYHEVMRHDS